MIGPTPRLTGPRSYGRTETVVAQLDLDGADLVVRLSALEKFGALRGDVRLPLSSFRNARATSAPFDELSGTLRWLGTGVWRVIALGTYRGRGTKAFAAVHRGRPGVVVDLDGGPYQRLVVSTPDAHRIVGRLDPG